MSQAKWTQQFARGAERGEERNKRLALVSRLTQMPRAPRLADKRLL